MDRPALDRFTRGISAPPMIGTSSR